MSRRLWPLPHGRVTLIVEDNRLVGDGVTDETVILQSVIDGACLSAKAFRDGGVRVRTRVRLSRGVHVVSAPVEGRPGIRVVGS